jgi:hypothetical protein
MPLLMLLTGVAVLVSVVYVAHHPAPARPRPGRKLPHWSTSTTIPSAVRVLRDDREVATALANAAATQRLLARRAQRLSREG